MTSEVGRGQELAGADNRVTERRSGADGDCQPLLDQGLEGACGSVVDAARLGSEFAAAQPSGLLAQKRIGLTSASAQTLRLPIKTLAVVNRVTDLGLRVDQLAQAPQRC